MIFWILVTHLTTIHKANPFGWVLGFIMFPFISLVLLLSSREFKRDTLEKTLEGWRNGKSAVPPAFVVRRVAALRFKLG
jgi:membrane protein implicated in regulation of membrane protease activity